MQRCARRESPPVITTRPDSSISGRCLRMIQGIGVGGEWGGSVLLAMEWSRHNGQRGLVASWPQFGAPCGLFLANLSVLAISTWSGDQFATWGWRVPFALSIILVGVGLRIRFDILETPVFQQLLDKKKIERTPVIEVIKKQPKEIILSALLRMSHMAPFYIFTAFIFAYAVGTLHMSQNFILTAVLVASCVSFITIPLSGHISDRIGRKKMYLIGAASMGLFGFLYFAMVDTAIPSVVFIAIVLSLVPHDMQWGPLAALIAEAFTPRLRYSGSSLGFQFASVIAGGRQPSGQTMGRVALRFIEPQRRAKTESLSKKTPFFRRLTASFTALHRSAMYVLQTTNLGVGSSNLSGRASDFNNLMFRPILLGSFLALRLRRAAVVASD
jgi:MFS family permease